MLDRLISGAGALTDLGDRAMRVLSRRRGRDPLAARPGSVIVAVLLVALAGLLVVAGLEVAGDPTPRPLSADSVASDRGLGDRAYATVDGAIAQDYIETFVDIDGDGEMDEGEMASEWYYFLVDPDSLRGVTVRSTRPPEQVLGDSVELVPVTLTGMLRRDERTVSGAKETSGLAFDELGLEVTDHYLLDEGTGPANPFLALGLAVVVALLAGGILVGLAGGYVVYRRSHGPLPEPATRLALGERMPLKVTGLLRTPEGLIHVRETAADLVRFPTTLPPIEAGGEGAEPGSTLIIERPGRPEGVGLGLGQLVRLTAGDLVALRGVRPALRVVAGTGPLVLSFSDDEARDRAAAELLDETGLGSGSDVTDRTEG